MLKFLQWGKRIKKNYGVVRPSKILNLSGPLMSVWMASNLPPRSGMPGSGRNLEESKKDPLEDQVRSVDSPRLWKVETFLELKKWWKRVWSKYATSGLSGVVISKRRIGPHNTMIPRIEKTHIYELLMLHTPKHFYNRNIPSWGF